LIRLFEKWIYHQNVHVREISRVVNFFQIQPKKAQIDVVDNCEFDQDTQVVVIQSDGKVNCDDSLIPALQWRQKQQTYSVFSDRLSDFVNDRGIREMEASRVRLPQQCIKCKWVKLCGGGSLENRFSTKRGFDNPSIYCAGLMRFFDYITNFIQENGYPRETIESAL
ncbi:radical SAM domain containing protein, partial [mine drainage metagenome]